MSILLNVSMGRINTVFFAERRGQALARKPRSLVSVKGSSFIKCIDPERRKPVVLRRLVSRCLHSPALVYFDSSWWSSRSLGQIHQI